MSIQASLPTLFEAQVQQSTDKVAVKMGEDYLTYAQLNQKANQVAHFLSQTTAIQPGDCIALLLPRDLTLSIALWGVLKAGAGYVLLDTDEEAESIYDKLAHSQAKLILTEVSWLNRLENLDMPLHTVSAITKINTLPTTNLQLTIQPTQLACLHYTNTQQTVMFSQQNILHFCEDLPQNLHWHSTDTLLTACPFNCETMTVALIGGLLVGLTADLSMASLSNEQISVQLQNQQASILYIDAEALENFLNQQGIAALETVKVLVIRLAGKSLSPTAVEQLKTLSQTLVYQVEGWEEINLWSSLKTLDRKADVFDQSLEESGDIYILDTQMQPVPVGVKGYVYLGATGESLGYWQDDTAAQTHSIVNPFHHEEKLYKTGQLGYWSETGEVVLQS